MEPAPGPTVVPWTDTSPPDRYAVNDAFKYTVLLSPAWLPPPSWSRSVLPPTRIGTPKCTTPSVFTTTCCDASSDSCPIRSKFEPSPKPFSGTSGMEISTLHLMRGEEGPQLKSSLSYDSVHAHAHAHAHAHKRTHRSSSKSHRCCHRTVACWKERKRSQRISAYTHTHTHTPPTI